MTEPRHFINVAVVILNCNNPEDTLACLQSVNALDYETTRIMVVDNGSTDDSVARIRTEHPDIEIIETADNLGYAGGNNVGIRYALDQEAQIICILNNDVLVKPDLFRALLPLLPTNSPCDGFPCSQLQDRLHLVRHGLVLEDLGLDTPQEKSPSSLCRFGYVGQVSHVKGVDLLVDACSRLLDDHQDVSLTIWGAGHKAAPYVARLRATCRRLPTVDLHGRYEPAQVAEILRDIDVLVMPARWPEIGPFIVLEAFAARTPVIGGAIGHIPELVDHERNGLLFEPDSVADLERQMRRILDEPHLLHRLREGIGPVRTAEDEMRETMEVYSHLVCQQ